MTWNVSGLDRLMAGDGQQVSPRSVTQDRPPVPLDLTEVNPVVDSMQLTLDLIDTHRPDMIILTDHKLLPMSIAKMKGMVRPRGPFRCESH